MIEKVNPGKVHGESRGRRAHKWGIWEVLSGRDIVRVIQGMVKPGFGMGQQCHIMHCFPGHIQIFILKAMSCNVCQKVI